MLVIKDLIKIKIVVYDTNKDNIDKVSDKFASLGYEVYKFEDYKAFADNDAIKQI